MPKPNSMKTGIIAWIGFLMALILPGTLMAQNKVTVSGTVTDSEAQTSLPGVAIYVDGDKMEGIGVTNLDGEYTVTVDEGARLIFRLLGYADFRVTARAGRTRVDVPLKLSESSLDQVVVVGYRAKARELTTGSAVVISGDELQDVPVSNVEQLLQGKVAGLNIQVNTGAPGFRGSAALRGLSALSVTGQGNETFLTPTSPLYVVDGVPIESDGNFEYGFQTPSPGMSPLSLIPQQDIESVEVLKDAQATALYGSRGAYGVILITTRRGMSKIPIVRYNSNFFLNTPPQLRTTLGGKFERNTRIQQILENGYYHDILRISTTPFLADSLNPFYANSTDWQDVFFGNSFNHSHNISISGGDPKFNYKSNLGYYNEKGVQENTGFSRYSLNMNMEYRPSEKLRVYGALFGAMGKRSVGSGQGLINRGVAENAATSSLMPGPSYFLTTSSIISSLKTRNNNSSKNLRANVDINYQLVPGLNVATSGSYDYTSDTEDTFTPAAANNQFSEVYGFNGRRSTIYNRNTISYYRSFNETHNFYVSGFNEFYIKKFQNSAIRQEKTPNDQFQGPLGFDGWYSRGGGLTGFRDERIASFAGTFSYDYKKKYVLDFSYRWDGTSLSGLENPYSKNPAIGFRWNFNKEKIFENADWLSYSSLRLSWGKNIVPTGSLLALYGNYVIRGTYNNNPRIGIDYNELPNLNLLPKTTTQYNLGLELGFLDNRLEIMYDTYYRQVDNEFLYKFLPDVTGFNTVGTNEAAMANYGHEISLTVRPLPPASKLVWSLTFNGAMNKDVLLQLPDAARQRIHVDNVTGQHILFRVGRNTLTNFLIDYQGVYASDLDVPVDPLTGLRYSTNRGNNSYFKGGDPIWEDINGDYVLNSLDNKASGNLQPLFTGGIYSYLSYKKFTLAVNAAITWRRSILNNALAERLAYFSNPFDAKALVDIGAIDYWRQEGDNAVYPYPFDYTNYGAKTPFRPDQTLFEEDGSYLKIANATFSYLFDQKLISRWGIRSLRLYLSANNIITFSRYSGPNPENVSAVGRDMSAGYPVPRTYNVGIDVEF
ncbi:TonB-linked SusC/RagA family outer membrane protein [Anseongella ginsenosidimutans]|uniref:TonB-linked SusC/RagA family outer membrane protein n=2 Tax=Anseongella ginsenosidimutans TaxID=496056 RepID=A0A4R3KMR6_9SPHI|nr:TonB-linked SusC/RagA family outer membrane protein [Anseongella ginsenosidimutans]